MDFFFFILTTGALLIRPGELHPTIQTLLLYEVFIVLTVIFSFQSLMPQFEGADLKRSPITICVILYYVCVLMSHFGNGQFDEGIDQAMEFAKMFLYYFLIVGIVNTKKRFISYLKWTTLFALICVGIAFLHFWKYFSIAGQENLLTEMDNGVLVERMGGTGLFKDPNDFAAIAAVFIPASLYFVLRRGVRLPFRIFWVGTIVVFFRAIQESVSRGGLVALGAGIVGIVIARFKKKSLFILPFLPLGLLLVGGRQGDLSLTSGTGQERIQLQHAGLGFVIRRPIFGVGAYHYELEVEGNHVAHNTFLQALVELGIFGGAVFAAVYFFATLMLFKVAWRRTIVDPDLAQVRPFIVGMIFSQIAAKMSLSQGYQVPTFLFWGLAMAFAKICQTDPPIDKWYRNQFLLYVIVVGIVDIVFFFVYLNTMIRFS